MIAGNNNLTTDLASKWVAYWEAHHLFRSSPSAKKPYVMVMPPPNVTGILHMGHVLNQTVQDVLVRRARMQGRETCWVPGTDHASIATEAKVVARLKAQGISKADLGRAGFLKEAWKWKEEYGGIIVRQLKRLGISCDWERLRFTMEPDCSKAVIKGFIDLYRKGLVYRDTNMVNWDPMGKTVLSNEEVLYREVAGTLYHIRYKLAGCAGSVTVATTRPETLLGDTALCVHPEDARYQHLHGQRVLVPLVNREIPVITDAYVDQGFGTGCLKVTPAHDANDYVLAKRHGLEIINIFTVDGKLNAAAQCHVGCSGVEARDRIVVDLEVRGLLEKKVSHLHNVGFSERTGAVVEPRISTQWFVNMKALAKPAIASVEDGAIRFYPGKFVNMYMSWMKKIRDWCISRQLWWGQRIPVYYLADGRFVVAASSAEALAEARELTGDPHLGQEALQQDPDVLDTWFSSWLWPLSVFNGTIDPENEEFAYYYPTDDLVTAPEIIFFWVARMVMAGHAFAGRIPFKNVYFTGIVRDSQGRKMSKSLGNSPDPMVLMEKYGADGVRAGMLFCAPAGNDLFFEERLCVQGRQFAHKIQHAWKLVRGWSVVGGGASQTDEVAIRWFEARCNEVLGKVNRCFSEFRLSEALMAIYRLIWDDFCAHFLEMIKPRGSKEVSLLVYEKTLSFFACLMKLLHPFMPFVTEEVWQQLRDRKKGASIVVAAWPMPQLVDKQVLADAVLAFELIAKVRRLKAQAKAASSELSLAVQGTKPAWMTLFEGYFSKATKMSLVEGKATEMPASGAFVVGKTTCWLVGLADTSKVDEGMMMADLAYQEAFLAIINKKLENPRFVAHAPEAVLQRERKKQSDVLAKVKALKGLLRR